MKRLLAYLFIVLGLGLTFNVNANISQIDESDRNLDKIKRIIINDPEFFKKSKYFSKIIKKGIDPKTKRKVKTSVLAIYFNYEKTLQAITNNPEMNSIGKFAWGFEFSKKKLNGLTANFTGQKAIKACYKHAKKKKLSDGECIFVDFQNQIGDWSSGVGENYLYKERQKRKILASGKIDESDKMLNKLYKIIMNNKNIRKKYLKYSELGKYNKTKIKSLTLAVSLNYEKEIIKLMLYPSLINFKPISDGWIFNTHSTYGISNSVLATGKKAIENCDKKLKKQNSALYEQMQCVLVDYRELDRHTGNLLFSENFLFNLRENKTLITRQKTDEAKKEQELLARLKAEDKAKKEQELLAKQKADEEKKKQELLAKQKADEEKKKQELLAKQKADEAKNEQELLVKQKELEEKFKERQKDQNIDDKAPKILIAEKITTNSQVYTLKGTVKDQSEFILEIDGQPLKLDEKGNFVFEGFVIDEDEGEELSLVAIDRWNNISEKTVTINVEIKKTKVTKSYEKLMPNKIKVKKNENRIALVIGIEKYENLTNLDALYANRDAKAFRAYANRALGIPMENIKLLVDQEASRSDTLKALKLWLPQKTKGSKKDIFIFFAGHGLASDDGEDLYVLPQDGDSILLKDTAISRTEMFEQIEKLNPNSVTMFFDTCYSGQTRKEETLIAGLRPIRIVANEQETPSNFTIFSASNLTQTSGSIEEAKHGMFSYYLMKGLEGKADENKDKKITNGELIAYLKDNVSQEAFTQNRQQDPMLAGDPDKVLMSY